MSERHKLAVTNFCLGRGSFVRVAELLGSRLPCPRPDDHQDVTVRHRVQQKTEDAQFRSQEPSDPRATPGWETEGRRHAWLGDGAEQQQPVALSAAACPPADAPVPAVQPAERQS